MSGSNGSNPGNSVRAGAILLLAVAVGAVLLVLIPGSPGKDPEQSAPSEVDRSGWPEVIRLGVLPEETPSRMALRYEPLVEYLETRLHRPVELVFGASFTSIIELFAQEEVELSKLGSFAYVQATERANVEAFVQGVRDASAPTYRSYIITRSDSGMNAVWDLPGSTFAWVDPASTSGYLFPRSLLIGLLDTTDAELDSLFASTGFSGGHDRSVQYVIDATVDAAAVSDSQIQRMRSGNHPGIDRVKVLAKTDAIPRSPEVYRRDLPASLREELRRAYLEFDHREFLEAHNYGDGFVPVEDSAYDVVREVAERLGLDH